MIFWGRWHDRRRNKKETESLEAKVSFESLEAIIDFYGDGRDD